MKINKAMILAAGFGKRLLPLTKQTPKPLLELKGKKLLQYSIEFLLSNKINDIIINTHYLSEQIEDFIHQNFPQIVISYEKNILDTGGGIMNAISFFQGENFLVLNSDTIWTLHYQKELSRLTEIFENGKSKAALLLVKKENSFDPNFIGDFDLDNKNFITKKNKQYIFTGCQLLNPNIFENYKKKIFSMNEIWHDLIETNSLNGFLSEQKFLHATDLNIFNKLNNSKIIDL
jgi:MurNAc alpha-1-phosphate uridylyltransferase